MSDWTTFFAMGGYAAFVWPAYAISIFALTSVALVSWRGMRRAERLAKRSDEREAAPAPR